MYGMRPDRLKYKVKFRLFFNEKKVCLRNGTRLGKKECVSEKHLARVARKFKRRLNDKIEILLWHWQNLHTRCFFRPSP